MKKIIFLSIICIISLIINKHAIAENNFKKVYFAGGCFWCMEESFDKVDGVINSKYPIYNYSPGSKQIDGVTSATSQYFANKGLLYTYRDGKRVDTTHLHVKDWLDSIRNGSQPKCDIEVAFQEGVTCAMATESYLKGKRIEWDPVNRRLI